MEFPRQEYWSWLPFPTPGDLPNLGIKHASLVYPTLAGRSFSTAPYPERTIIQKYTCTQMFSSVQTLSRIPLCEPMDCSTPGFPGDHQLLELLKRMCIELVMPSNHHIVCHPLLLPSINESVLHIRWPKYWSFNISPSSEYSGVISFRMGSFDLLAVQGTLKSLLQHHSSKASIVWCSALWSNSHIHTWLLGKP